MEDCESATCTTKHTHTHAIHGLREASKSQGDANLAGTLEECPKCLQANRKHRERESSRADTLSTPPPTPLASAAQERTILDLRAELDHKEHGKLKLQEQLDKTETQLQKTQRELVTTV